VPGSAVDVDQLGDLGLHAKDLYRNIGAKSEPARRRAPAPLLG
jgi:hypothetical protein